MGDTQGSGTIERRQQASTGWRLSDLQEELQGGTSLRIADSDAESMKTVHSARSASPGDPVLYRTSSPVQTGSAGSSAWSQDQGSYRSAPDQGSIRSSQD